MNLETVRTRRFGKKFWLKAAGVIVVLSLFFNFGVSSAKVDLGGEKVNYDELVKVISDKEKDVITVEGKLDFIEERYSEKKLDYDAAMKVVENKKKIDGEIVKLNETIKTKQGEIAKLDTNIKTKQDELAKIKEDIKEKTEAQAKETTSTQPEVEFFKNCTELRKKYPNGISSDHPSYQSKMDRDKDNYACEE